MRLLKPPSSRTNKFTGRWTSIQKHLSSWWLNHPSEKYARQIASFPQGSGVKIPKMLELPPPSCYKGMAQLWCGTKLAQLKKKKKHVAIPICLANKRFLVSEELAPLSRWYGSPRQAIVVFIMSYVSNHGPSTYPPPTHKNKPIYPSWTEGNCMESTLPKIKIAPENRLSQKGK